MSNNILKSVAVIALGGLFGYASVHYLKPETKNRFIASYKISKMGKEQNARDFFDIKINTDEIARSENEVSTLKISVIALKTVGTGLIYNWNLPQDTTLVEGNLNGGLGDFTVNQSKEFVVKVKGFSKQLKKYISFEIQGQADQRELRREVLISSRIEDSFEYIIQQNELKRAQSQIYKLGNDKTKSKFSPEHIVH